MILQQMALFSIKQFFRKLVGLFRVKDALYLSTIVLFHAIMFEQSSFGLKIE